MDLHPNTSRLVNPRMEGRPDLGVILPFGRRSFRIEFLELMAGFAGVLSPLFQLNSSGILLFRSDQLKSVMKARSFGLYSIHLASPCEIFIGCISEPSAIVMSGFYRGVISHLVNSLCTVVQSSLFMC